MIVGSEFQEVGRNPSLSVSRMKMAQAKGKGLVGRTYEGELGVIREKCDLL